MPQVQLTDLQHILVKVEATEGTDAVPVTTDALQLIGPATLAWGTEKRNSREALYNGFIDEEVDIQPSALFGEVTLRIWGRGRGAAYSGAVKPEIDALWQAAAMAVSTSFTGGSEFYKYDTAGTGQKTVTIYGFEVLESGVFVKHVILAAKVSRVNVTMDAGGVAVFEFTLRGLYNAPADAADVAPTYLTPVPPLFAGAASWTINALSPVVRSASFGIDLTLIPRFNANAAIAGNIGLVGYLITKRRNTWGAVVESARVADYNPHDEWRTAAQRQILATIAGGAAGAQYNRIKVTADKAVIEDPPGLNDEGGLRTYQVAGKCGPQGTNRLLFTYD